jgi:hypothetical protein
MLLYEVPNTLACQENLGNSELFPTALVAVAAVVVVCMAF